MNAQLTRFFRSDMAHVSKFCSCTPTSRSKISSRISTTALYASCFKVPKRLDPKRCLEAVSEQANEINSLRILVIEIFNFYRKNEKEVAHKPLASNPIFISLSGLFCRISISNSSYEAFCCRSQVMEVSLSSSLSSAILWSLVSYVSVCLRSTFYKLWIYKKNQMLRHAG